MLAYCLILRYFCLNNNFYDMDIIDKLIEAEEQPQKVIALGIAVLCGYEMVTIREYYENVLPSSQMAEKTRYRRP